MQPYLHTIMTLTLPKRDNPIFYVLNESILMEPFFTHSLIPFWINPFSFVLSSLTHSLIFQLVHSHLSISLRSESIHPHPSHFSLILSFLFGFIHPHPIPFSSHSLITIWMNPSSFYPIFPHSLIPFWSDPSTFYPSFQPFFHSILNESIPPPSRIWLTLPSSAERHRPPERVRAGPLWGQRGAPAAAHVELSPPARPSPAHPAGGATGGPDAPREELHR